MAARQKRLLLVQHHTDTRVVTAMLLRKQGYIVDTAATKAEALRLCEAEQFDLLIGDLGLPDGSGLDLMREIADKCHIKGIAYTGYGYEQDVASAREAGYFASLVKPVDLNTFFKTIEAALGESPGD
jgi:DNA-binding NtrC family response regulator